jgi:hypothetical protein
MFNLCNPAILSIVHGLRPEALRLCFSADLPINNAIYSLYGSLIDRDPEKL